MGGGVGEKWRAGRRAGVAWGSPEQRAPLATTRCACHRRAPPAPLLQTSLARFVELYEAAIDQSERAVLPAKRIHNILEHMTCGLLAGWRRAWEAGGAGCVAACPSAVPEPAWHSLTTPTVIPPLPPTPLCSYEIYLYIQRGLFERHKLIFALMLANKILVGGWAPVGSRAVVWASGGRGSRACVWADVQAEPTPCPKLLTARAPAAPPWPQVSSGQIRAEQVDAFLRGGGALDIAAVRKKPKEWVPGACCAAGPGGLGVGCWLGCAPGSVRQARQAPGPARPPVRLPAPLRLRWAPHPHALSPSPRL